MTIETTYNGVLSRGVHLAGRVLCPDEHTVLVTMNEPVNGITAIDRCPHWESHEPCSLDSEATLGRAEFLLKSLFESALRVKAKLQVYQTIMAEYDSYMDQLSQGFDNCESPQTKSYKCMPRQPCGNLTSITSGYTTRICLITQLSTTIYSTKL